MGQIGGNNRHSKKWILLLAIVGCITTERWSDLWLAGGTTSLKMITFIGRILADIGPGTANRRRCFVTDNFNSLHNQQIAAMIYAARHRLAFRAPCYPVDGPIEYVFNTVQSHMTINMHKVANNGGGLCNQTRIAITAITTFVPYFENCGYIGA